MYRWVTHLSKRKYEGMLVIAVQRNIWVHQLGRDRHPRPTFYSQVLWAMGIVGNNCGAGPHVTMWVDRAKLCDKKERTWEKASAEGESDKVAFVGYYQWRCLWAICAHSKSREGKNPDLEIQLAQCHFFHRTIVMKNHLHVNTRTDPSNPDQHD